MISIPHDKLGRPRPSWYVDDNFNIVIVCKLGHRFVLDEHDVRPDGEVHPKANCPVCEFSEIVVLGGWSRGL